MVRRLLRPAALALLCGLAPAHAQNLNTSALLTLQAAGASTLISADQPNTVYRGAIVGVGLTAMASATVVIHIQGRDFVSGTYYDILVGPALTTTGFTELVVYPGAAATANSSTPSPLPTTWRIEAVVTGASAAASGTVGAALIQ
jgi:hypothetical protein